MHGRLSGTSVIIPSRNEDHKILDTITHNLERQGAEVIVVDDGSDNPYPQSIKHGVSYGYGAALLTGIKNSTNSIIITCDGDGQHQVKDIVNLHKVWNMLNVDMIIGMRRVKNEIWYRFIGRKVLNWTASLVACYWLNDLNSGLRIFKKHVVFGYRDILCQKFSFTTSLTMSMICDNYKVEFFPIDVLPRQHGKSRVKVVRDGIVTLYYILKIGFALRTRGIRTWFRNLLSIGKIGITP